MTTPQPDDETRSTKALRFHKGDEQLGLGLLAWYENHAKATGQSVNRALLRGLAAHRAAVEGNQREDQPA
jgi:hypothetical protein